MGSNVFSNMVSIAHKGSGDFSTVSPDVCKTPTSGGPVPIPYTNTAMSSSLSGGSKTVKIQGYPAATMASCYSISTGNEPGSVGGVVSGKTKGKAKFVNYSFDIKIEGKSACRHGDLMTHNDKNTMG